MASAGRPSIRRLQVIEDALCQLPALFAIEPSFDRVPRLFQFAPQRHQAMTIARLGLLGLGRLEQHDVTIEQARHAAHQAIREPQEDQRNAHQPEDRQRHPQKANRNPAHAEEWAEWSRRRTCPRHGIFQLSDCDLVEDEAERQRRDQVDHKMASEIRQPIWREGQLERKLEKEDRANRQIGPGEELVLPDREACCRCLLQNNLARDQGKENQDQDENGVFQDGNKSPAKKALHPQGQQFFLPLRRGPAATAARRAASGGEGEQALLAPVGRWNDRNVRRWSTPTHAEYRLCSRSRSRFLLVATVPARDGQTLQILSHQFQPRHRAAQRHILKKCERFADLVSSSPHDALDTTHRGWQDRAR